MSLADRRRAVGATYGAAGLADALMRQLTGQVGDRPLTTDDLLAFDELHVMGRQATETLGRAAGLTPAMTVLDVGCGLGGPARTLACRFGCTVVGVDLSEPFVTAAARLTAAVGLDHQVGFVLADALALPFAPAAFDAVVLFHVAMNVADKIGLFTACRRMLRSGGVLAAWEIVSRRPDKVVYPVPWATDPSFSHLASLDRMAQAASAAGFGQVEAHDETCAATGWIQARLAAPAKPTARRPTVDLDRILPDFRRKRANVSANLLGGAIGIARLLARA